MSCKMEQNSQVSCTRPNYFEVILPLLECHSKYMSIKGSFPSSIFLKKKKKKEINIVEVLRIDKVIYTLIKTFSFGQF